MSAKPEPELTCHLTVGAGDPLAAAVKLAFAPYVIDTSVGFVVNTGAVQNRNNLTQSWITV